MNIQAIDTRHGTANQHSFQMEIVYLYWRAIWDELYARKQLTKKAAGGFIQKIEHFKAIE